MKKRYRDRWVAALRSGEYKQGEAKLFSARSSGNYYCCLGVARELFSLRKARYIEHLSSGALKKIGLTGGEQIELANMNDDGKRFSTIANWIEKNL